jgi:serine protease Do
VVGVIVSQLNAKTMFEVADNVPQNVNFAIQTPMVVNFLTIKGVSPAVGDRSRTTLEPANVADLAKGFTVQITCGQ